DGVFINSVDTGGNEPANPNDYNVMIGLRENPDYARIFNGSIDEVAIYNRSLSASEIAAMYNLQVGRYYWKGNVSDATTSSESARWYFDRSIYGTLSVDITYPTTNIIVNQSDTFNINATATCVGGPCGPVYASVRYNISTSSPDTNINILSGSTPFYLQAPIHLWNVTDFTGVYSRAVALDSSDNIIITGWDGSNDYYTVKYNNSGQHEWNTTDTDGWRPYAITVDNQDNIIVAGTQSVNYYTIKYNSSGQHEWNITDTTGNYVYGAVVDNQNNVIITGKSDTNQYYTIKYNDSGQHEWNITDTAGYAAYGIALDNENNIIITGRNDTNQYYTIKYDENGTHLWNATDTTGYQANAVTVDNENNIIITGYTSTFDYYTVKYNSTGDHQWNTTNTKGSQAGGVAVDSLNNIIITGYNQTGPDYYYHTVKYDSTGNHLFNITSAKKGLAYKVVIDSEDNIIVTGNNGSISGGDYHTIKYSSINPLRKNVSAGESWNVSWTVNTTGIIGTSWWVDVLFNASQSNSSVPVNDTNNRKITIQTTSPSITLNNPVNGSSTINNYQLINATVTDTDNDNTDAKLLCYYADEIDASEETGLVFLMHLNNNSALGENDTVFIDQSGQDNNGTCGDSSLTVYPTFCPTLNNYGKFYKSYLFDGENSDDAILIPDDSSISGLSEITVSIWILPTEHPENCYSTTCYNFIVGKSNYSGDREYRIRYEETNPEKKYVWHVSSDGDDPLNNETIISASNVSLNEWHHLVGTWNNNTGELRFYLDGVLKDTDSYAASSIFDGSANLAIGTSSDNNGSSSGTVDDYRGTIDEVAIYNRTLSDIEIKTLYYKGSYKLLYQNENLANGTEINYNLTSMPLSVDKNMVLLMHFDNDSSKGENDTFVYDWTGLESNGTCSGVTCPNITQGRFGKAYNYSSSSSTYFVVKNNSNINLNGNITVATWYYPMSVGSGELDHVVSKWGSYALRLGSSSSAYPGFIFSLWDSSEINAYTGTEPSMNQWYHVVGTYDGSAMKLYVNGVLEDTNTTPDGLTSYDTSNLYLGEYEGGQTTYRANGLIDEVAIWNRSLNASEIAAMYSLQVGRYYWKGNVSDASTSSESSTWYFDVNETPDTTPPSISFVSPTPDNDEVLSVDYAYINVSTSDANNHSAFIDWNKTLVGWYNFEQYNSTGVNDSSTYQNFGSYSGGLSESNITTGIRGNALDCTGQQYLDTGATLIPTENFTVMLWVNIDDHDGWYSFVEQYNGGVGRVIIGNKASSQTGEIYFQIGGIGGNSNTQIPTNQWTHITITKNSTTATFYQNGIFDGTASSYTETITQAVNTYICAETQTLEGSLDEVMIFDRVLTPEEINASYNAGDWRLYNNFTSLADGNYSFKAWAIDAAGNINSTETRNITVEPSIVYNTCSPQTTQDLTINTVVNCANQQIVAQDLTVQNGGFFNLTNITLTAQNTVIDNSGSFAIKDSHNTIWQNGNLTINGYYNLTNSTLQMNGTSDGQVGVTVNGSGEMIINESSNITNGVNTTAEYFFIVKDSSSFTMENSYLSEAGWAVSPDSAGLEIRTTVKSFKNNFISDNSIALHVTSDNNVFRNITLTDSQSRGLYTEGTTNNSFYDFNISGAGLMGIQLSEFSNNPDNMLLENFVIESISADGVYVGHLNNVTFQNITIVSPTSEGFVVTNPIDNISFYNVTISNSGSDAIAIRANAIIDSVFNTITINDCSGAGIIIDNSEGAIAQNNNFTNMTIKNCNYGIVYDGSAITNNYVFNSKFEDNTVGGVRINQSTSNTFYNNYINNTNNLILNNESNVNYFNTSLTASTNIIGGSWIGGNFWANSTSNAYSQTCNDIDGNGICDDTYTPATNNTDYLPLTDNTQITCENCGDCSNVIQNQSGTGKTIYLSENIFGESGTCIDFNGSDDVTFDCDGYTIDGDKTVGSWGIFSENVNGGADNIIIQNCPNITQFYDGGIRLQYSQNVTIKNVIFSDSYNIFRYGFRFDSSQNISLYNISIYDAGTALYPVYSENINGNSLNFSGNSRALTFSASSDDHCNHTFTNSYAGTNQALVYYHNTQGLTIENNNSIGQLILCDVDDSSVSNITMDNQDGIHIFRSTNVTVNKVNVSGIGYSGLLFYSIQNSVIENSTFTNSNYFGVELSTSENNKVKNVFINNTSNTGLITSSNNKHNEFDNLTITSSNTYGIAIGTNSNNNNNTFKNSRIEDNTIAGVRIYGQSYNNTFYNNIFNNTINYLNFHNTTNYLNTTLTVGTNILGGSYLGGNFWTNPTNTGWSDNCSDASGDGICEAQYNASINNTDFLPLTLNGDLIYPSISFVSPTPDNDEALSVDYAYVNVSASDASNFSAFIDWNRSLVGWWNFEQYNTTGINDSSTYNNFASYDSGISQSNITTGKRGNALEFDNINDCLQVADDDSLDLEEDFTMAGWIYADTIDGADRLISRGNVVKDEGSWTFGFGTTWSGCNPSGCLDFAMNNSAYGFQEFTSGALGLQTDTWYHIAAIRKDDSVQLYLDGVAVGSPYAVNGNLTSDEPVWIGCRDNSASTIEHMDGLHDEVILIDRALTIEELNATINAGSWRAYNNFTNLTSGAYSFKAWSIDAAGNINSTETRNITVDTSPPGISFVSPTPNNNTVINEDYTYINVTTSDTSNYSAFIDWNKTLKGWYSFEYYNSTGINDSSTYNNFGTFNGTLSQSDITTGIRGNALEFDGNDYIESRDIYMIDDNADNYSYSLWFKKVGTNTGYLLCYTHDEDPSEPYSCIRWTTTNTLSFWVRNNDQDNIVTVSATGVSTDEWHHVVATKNGSEYKLYLDGVLNNTVTLAPSGTYTRNWFLLGSAPSGDTPANFYTGLIDEAMVFSRVLTPQEINASYNAGDWRLYNNFTSLSEGNYTYKAWAIDAGGNINSTEERIVTVDQTPPSLNIQIPVNDSTYRIVSIDLNYTVSDIYLDTCWYVNSTGQTTNLASCQNTTLNTVQGLQNITVYVNDTAGNTNSSQIFFTVDTQEPSISFVSPTPDNNTVINEDYTYINVTTSDASNYSAFIDWNKTLRAWYSFEYYNSTGVNDSSTYQNFASYAGGLSQSNIITGIRGNAIDCTGQQYLDTGATLIPTENFTVMLWVNMDNHGGWYSFIEQYLVSDDERVIIGNKGSGSTGEIYFQIGDEGGNSNTQIPIGQWAHVTITKNSTTAIFYLNGAFDGTATYSNNTIQTQNTMIGAAEQTLQGSLDEVMIFSRVLTPQEINASYNAGDWRLYNNFTSLSEGNYTYKAWAIDAGGNINSTEERIVTVDQTTPSISFNTPTPDNDETLTVDYAYINVTTSDANNHSAFIDWNRSLVGWWNFEQYNTTGVNDSSTYNNFGSYSGGLSQNNITTGIRGSALEFDDTSSQRITIDYNESLAPTNAITMAAWVYPHPSQVAYATMLGKNQDYALFTRNSNEYGFQVISSGGATWGYSTDTYIDNTWAYVVATYNTTDYKFYINGVEKTITWGAGPFTGNIVTDTDDLHIGWWGPNAGSARYFDGLIDEVMLFSRALTAQEINASYNARDWRAYNNFTSLVDGDYSFKSWAIDAVGNINSTETRNITVDTSPPSISFVSPTPDNNTQVNNSYAYVNVSTSDFSNHSAFIDWNRSLVGWWNFEQYNTTGVNDSSTYNNFASFSVITESNITAGVRGNAIEFDGVDNNEKIQVGTTDAPAALKFTGDFTVCSWIKTTADPGYNARIIGRDDAGANRAWWIDQRATTNYPRLVINGANAVEGTTAVNDGKWNQICAVNDEDGDAYIYINGNLDATGVSGGDTVDTLTVPLLIGLRGDNNQDFEGLIDEVMIFTRLLTPEEINASYNAGDWRLYNNFTSLAETNYTYKAWAIDAGGNINSTEERIVTVDQTTPSLNIQIPVNDSTYRIASIDLNYTVSDIYLDTCWYVNSTGQTTNLASCQNTTLNTVQGLQNITVYVNDTAGNTNSSQIFFTVDTQEPSIGFVSPTPDNDEVLSVDYAYVNVSASDASNFSAFIDWNNTLVGWWNFESTSATGVYDNSTYSNFGDFGGGISESNITSGIRGNAAKFDGSDDYINISDDSSLSLADNFTITAWIKTPADTGWRAIIEKDNKLAGDRNYWLGLSGGGGSYGTEGALIFLADDGIDTEGLKVYSSATLDDNQWHHVVGIASGSNSYIYIDGVQVGTDTHDQGVDTNSYDVHIGGYNDGTYAFGGLIDEVMIFNRVFTPQEINASFNAGDWRLYNNFTGLLETNYTYKAWAIDAGGNINSTEERTISYVAQSTTCEGSGGEWNGTVCCGDNGGVGNDTDCYFDIGLRVYNGSETQTLAVHGNFSNLENSSLRIAKNDTIYSIALVNTADSAASDIRIRTTVLQEIATDSNTVLLFHLNNDSAYGEGPTLFYDFSDGLDNGSCSGGTCPTVTSQGRVDKAVLYDGDDDDIMVSNTGSKFTFEDTNFSAGAWVNPRNFDSGGTYFLSRWVWLVGFNSTGHPMCGIYGSPWWIIYYDTPVELNNWTHVMCTYHLDNATRRMIMFIDGQEVDSMILPGTSQDTRPQDLGVGCGMESGSCAADRRFNGTMDEVVIYNQSLSSAQVQNLYNNNIMAIKKI
ncbi:hypothetical protein GOV04_01805, partial [Candidatus Woesearchaeota archaeon]|nr:hypothetical protein [Candidatus Woesearchaeota archaeon]